MNLEIHPPLPRRKDFRIGILGSGFIVNDCHLVAYRKAGFNPVAIASRNRENAARVAQHRQIATVYETYEQLLDDPSIEVLDIAVAPNAQLDLIKAACVRKTVKGILAQKPLGVNYAEALQAVQLCEAAGITLAVNQNMRYDQSVRAAKTLLDGGVLGEPVFATIEMRAIPHWMPWQKDLGWLTLRIMSIHHLDTLRYWFGEPERIFCSTRTDPRTSFKHTDGICTYILEYANGLRCVGIDDTWAGPAKEGCPSDNYIRWRIEGTNGLARGDIGWCKDPFTTPSTIRYASKGDTAFQEPRWTESWFPDAFIGTMAQLLIAVEDGKAPAISGRDNLKTMALVEAAEASAVRSSSVALAEFEHHLAHKLPLASAPTSPRKPVTIKKLSTSTAKTIEPIAGALDGYTPRAAQTLLLAKEEAEHFSHNFISPEHLLLALLRLAEGVAHDALVAQQVAIEIVRAKARESISTWPNLRADNEVLLSLRLKEILELARDQSRAMGHPYVGTEHLLLGLLMDGESVAARILCETGASLEDTLAAVAQAHAEQQKSQD